MDSVLVIEDNIQFVEIINSFLTSKDFLVYTALNGETAIAKLRSYEQFSVVIIDVFLPDILGIELIHIVKKFQPQAGIVIMTGDRSLPLRAKSFSAGSDEYLAKPFSMNELEIRIRRLIQYKSLLNQTDGIQNILPRKSTARYFVEGAWLCDGQTRLKIMQLSRTQMELLKILLKSTGKLVSAEVLRSKLRNESSNALSVAFHRLNMQLTKSKIAMRIKALYGFGYVLQEAAEEPIF